jgi:large subunit ribosomal protein L3
MGVPWSRCEPWCFHLSSVNRFHGSAPGSFTTLSSSMVHAPNLLTQDPGRIFPGKKMPGRMGNERRTIQNLPVVRVDTELDLIFVKGVVPGVDDAHVLVRDAKKKMNCLSAHSQAKGLYEKVLPKGVDDLPFPAGTAEVAKALPKVIEAPSYRRSPFIPIE